MKYGSIGGSYVGDDIEDYYLTPYALGYGPFVKFDHESSAARRSRNTPRSPSAGKVTFAWNAETC